MTMTTFTTMDAGVKNEEIIEQRKEEAVDIESCHGQNTSSLAVAETLRAFSNSSTVGQEADGDGDDSPSQVTLLLSQGDEQIRQMDNDGDLNMVAGPMSVLSQELHLGGISQPTDDDDDDDGEEVRYYNSQLTETSIAMAERLGLIPLTQEEEVSPTLPEELEETPTPAQLAAATSLFTKLEMEETEPTSPTQPPATTQPTAVKSEPFSPATRKGPIPDTATPVASRPYASTSTLRDTPIRKSECFGSLLDAVQKITEQEEIEERNAKLFNLQNEARVVAGYEYPPTTDACRRSSRTPKRKAPKVLPTVDSRSSAPSPKKARKAPPKSPGAPNCSAKSSIPSPKKGRTGFNPKLPGGIPKKASPQKAKKAPAVKPVISKQQQAANKLSKSQMKKAEQRNAQDIAQRAAKLAERTVSDPEMAKKLLLSMALVRENPRSLPSTWPPRGSIVPEGFFWAHYPPLEGVLKKHMAEYYELSTTKCQSAQQQTFNNELVIIVKEVATEQGWKFHKAFNDKSLRDRIRCYYKTHIQNAKKRLRTMLRNPTKKANARHLCVHLDLIEQHNAADEAAAAAQPVSAPSSADGGIAFGEEEQKAKEGTLDIVDKAMIREKERQARLWAAEEDKRIARVKQQKEAKEEQLRLRAAQFEAEQKSKESQRKEEQEQKQAAINDNERVAKEQEETKAAKIIAAEQERIAREKAKIEEAAAARAAREKAEIEIARREKEEAARLKTAEAERSRLKAAEEARKAREKDLEAQRVKAAEEEKKAREKEQEAARRKAVEVARVALEQAQEAARLKAAEEAQEKEQDAARIKAEEARIDRRNEVPVKEESNGSPAVSTQKSIYTTKKPTFTMKRPTRTLPGRSASSSSKKPSQPPPAVRKSPRKRSKPAV